MKYTLPYDGESCVPEVHVYLCTIDKSYLHNKEHGLMHPADIFTAVFDEVIASGGRLVTSLLEMNDDREKRRDVHINSLISGFLYSLSNFIDGCKSIIKCFFPKQEEKKYKKIISDFMRQCKEYIDYVNTKINYIKHRHRNIATILCEWDDKFIIGYYVNGPVSDNLNGPDPDIHKDVNCAISMNWDIPYHIVNVYWLSASLKAFINEIRLPTVSFESKSERKDVAKFLEDISLIKRVLLPDEFSKKQAAVKKSASGYILEYPSKLKAENTKPHNMNISMTTKIGHGARGFVTPYGDRTKQYITSQLTSRLRRRTR